MQQNDGGDGSDSVPDRRVIDRHQFVPHYLGVLANGLIWSQSRHYIEHFGLGINEIRLLTFCAHTPDVTAKEICDSLFMNKSIVSRSVATLVSDGFFCEKISGKARRYRLTDKGYDLNTRVVRTSLAREKLLLDGFSPTDKAILVGYLARMLENLPKTVDFETIVATCS